MAPNHTLDEFNYDDPVDEAPALSSAPTPGPYEQQCAIAVEFSGPADYDLGPNGIDTENMWLTELESKPLVFKRDHATYRVVIDGEAALVERDGPEYTCSTDECAEGRAGRHECAHRAAASGAVQPEAICECGCTFVAQRTSRAAPGQPDHQAGRKDTFYCTECSSVTHTDVISSGGPNNTHGITSTRSPL